MTVPNQVSGDRAARIDLADPAFWRLPRPERLGAFARLRELEAPVLFTPGRAPPVPPADRSTPWCATRTC